jgi:hypothetical protein
MFYKKIFTILLLFIFSLSNAQEFGFPSSVISVGGEMDFKGSDYISNWRIGQINILEIDLSDLDEMTENELQIYPNPVEDILNIMFNIDSQKEFQINISDLSGRHTIISKNVLIISNENIEIDLSQFSSGIYIIKVQSKDLDFDESLKILKL